MSYIDLVTVVKFHHLKAEIYLISDVPSLSGLGVVVGKEREF